MGSVAISRSSTWKSLTVDISEDNDLTDVFDARPGAIYGLIIPSNFDGTQISFVVSHDNSTFVALYDVDNAQVLMTVAASRAYDLPTELAPWQYWKIVTLTAQATTDTIFTIVAKG